RRSTAGTRLFPYTTLFRSEERREIYQVMDDMRSAEVDFITIGQYLQPTPRHHKVERFVEPDEFEGFARMARAKGFLVVASSPLRSEEHTSELQSREKLVCR